MSASQRVKIRLVAACAMVLPLISLADDPVMVRPAAEGRIWQTVLDPSKPIEWPWVLGSDSARLTITSHWDEAVSTVVVEKEDGDLYGAYSMPGAPEGEERLYSVGLEYLSGDKVIGREYARLAYIPGVQGGGVTVLDPESKKWKKTKAQSVLLAYDRAWHSNSVDAVSATLSISPDTEIVLNGTSGYVPFRPTAEGNTLTLSFDGEPFWTANLWSANLGMLLLIR